MASENYLTKYATAVTVPLTFYNPADDRLQGTISWSAGDVKLIIDGVDQGNTTNLPTLVTGRKTWEIALTAGEVTGARIVLEFADQDGPAFYDDVMTIQTYGNAGASIPNLPATLASGSIASAELNNIADGVLLRDWTAIVASVPARCALNAFRFIRNKWSVVGSLLSVKKEDDLTDAWTATVTTASGQEPITSVDPT